MASFVKLQQGYLLAMINVGLLLLMFVVVMGTGRPEGFNDLAVGTRDKVINQGLDAFGWASHKDNASIINSIKVDSASEIVIWLDKDADMTSFLAFADLLKQIGVEKIHLAYWGTS